MSAAPPRGYVSEAAKRRYMTTAGVLAGVFVLAQFVLPMALMMAIMPAMFFSGIQSLSVAEPRRGAVWAGSAWYVEQKFDAPDKRLVSLPLDGKREAQDVAELPADEPWLLAGREGLWVVAPDYVGRLRDGLFEDVWAGELPGGLAPPLLLDGAPAVVMWAADGLRLLKLDDGEWREMARFSLGPEGELAALERDLRVLAAAGDLWLLYRVGGTLHWREGLPGGDGPREARGTLPLGDGPWAAAVVDGVPVVVRCAAGPSGKLTVYRLVGGQWEHLLRYNVGMAGEIGAFPTGEPGGLAILVQGMPGSVRLLAVEGDRVVRERRVGGGLPFSGTMTWAMFLPQWATMLLPLLLALILSSQMRKHRACTYSVGGVAVQYASLWRRGLAQTIDWLIAGWPMLVGSLLMLRAFSDFERILSGGWVALAAAFGAIGLGVVWALAALVVFSYLEGRYGATPGKKALGIRVVGTDLRPCGFARGFVRNILKIVDGFFNFLVGIVLVAFTEHWQRVGDLAARTIVIDARRLPEPLPQATVVG